MMSKYGRYLETVRKAALLIAVTLAAVIALFALGSAQMSDPNTDMEVTNSTIYPDGEKYVVFAEVTTIKKTDSMGFKREDSRTFERSYWVPVGEYDTRDEAEQGLDEFKERMESDGGSWI